MKKYLLGKEVLLNCAEHVFAINVPLLALITLLLRHTIIVLNVDKASMKVMNISKMRMGNTGITIVFKE